MKRRDAETQRISDFFFSASLRFSLPMIPGEIIVAKAAADEYPMNLGFLGKGNCATLLPPAVRRARAGEVFHLPFLRQRRSGALRALHWASA